MESMDSSKAHTNTDLKPIRVEVTLKPPNPKQPQCDQMRMLLDNHDNFKRTGLPARFMFYDAGSWVEFPDSAFRVLLSGFAAGKPMVDATIDGATYLFDFLRMLQIDFACGFQRSIAWIDVDGKCFFPKIFVGECDSDSAENSSEDVSLNSNSNSNSKKNKKRALEKIKEEGEGEGESESESSSNGCDNSSKRQRAVSVRESRWGNTRLIAVGERAYEIVNQQFLNGVRKVDPGATITSISRCTRNGPMGIARLELFKKQVEITKAARGNANVIMTWYGASVREVETILNYGFAMPSGNSGSGAHGVGVYLSPVSFPQMSAMRSETDGNGEKHVILCRVILGKVEKIEAGSKQSCPSSVNFDTGVDDLKNPRRYVVWFANMNTHILPECVVSFKPSDCVAGQLRGLRFLKRFPNATNLTVMKLFSMLQSSLPPGKMGELVDLYSTYKAGKVGKDVFIKQARLIAGDATLRSIMDEIHGSVRFC